MSNPTKEKIYFAIITNVVMLSIIAIIPLFFGDNLMADWYRTKVEILSSEHASIWIILLLCLCTIMIIILFGRSLYNVKLPSTNISPKSNANYMQCDTDQLKDLTNELASLNKIAELKEKRRIANERLATHKMNLVKTYLHEELCIYMKEEELSMLIVNVCRFTLEKGFSPIPVVTDCRLSTLDLRHLVWNIGKRLSWNGNQCSIFLKTCFPIEMKELEIETIRRNLRQRGTCLIELDIPENGSFEFHNTHTS